EPADRAPDGRRRRLVTSTETPKQFIPMERGEKQHSHGLPIAPTGSPAERFTSRNPADFTVPKGREEDWRFAPLRKPRPPFQPFTSEDTVAFETELPDGVTVSYAGADHPLFGAAVIPADRVSALAAANVTAVVVVTIPANLQADGPIVLRSTGKPGLNYGHL